MSLKVYESTLTYKGESVSMADKAGAEKLMGKMINDTHPELKGGKMAGIKIGKYPLTYSRRLE